MPPNATYLVQLTLRTVVISVYRSSFFTTDKRTNAENTTSL